MTRQMMLLFLMISDVDDKCDDDEESCIPLPHVSVGYGKWLETHDDDDDDDDDQVVMVMMMTMTITMMMMTIRW